MGVDDGYRRNFQGSIDDLGGSGGSSGVESSSLMSHGSTLLVVQQCTLILVRQ